MQSTCTDVSILFPDWLLHIAALFRTIQRKAEQES